MILNHEVPEIFPCLLVPPEAGIGPQGSHLRPNCVSKPAFPTSILVLGDKSPAERLRTRGIAAKTTQISKKRVVTSPAIAP